MEFLATKGIEYLMILGYLTLLIPFWLLLTRAREPVAALARRAVGAWFSVPDGYLLHRGHGWARPEEDGSLRVGMDEFAAKLLGAPNAVRLPEPGQNVEAGEEGWGVRVEDRWVPFRAPVSGRVLEVNREVLEAPESLADDPYESGWLIKVAPRSGRAALSNLLPTDLARPWMEKVSRQVQGLMGPELGAVAQDGGVVVSGFGRQLAGDEWYELSCRLLDVEDLAASTEGDRTIP